jgi:hypothetical protein
VSEKVFLGVSLEGILLEPGVVLALLLKSLNDGFSLFYSIFDLLLRSRGSFKVSICLLDVLELLLNPIEALTEMVDFVSP